MKKELQKVVKSAKNLVGIDDEKNLDVALINGSFAPAEAADILLSFINDKIKFHTVRQLQSQNDLNNTQQKSEERLRELREAKRKITDLVLQARNEGRVLDISSTIQITLKKQNH